MSELTLNQTNLKKKKNEKLNNINYPKPLIVPKHGHFYYAIHLFLSHTSSTPFSSLFFPSIIQTKTPFTFLLQSLMLEHKTTLFASHLQLHLPRSLSNKGPRKLNPRRRGFRGIRFNQTENILLDLFHRSFRSCSLRSKRSLDR